MRGFVEATLIAGRAHLVRDDGRIGGAMLAYGPSRYPPRMAAMAWLAYGPISGGPRTAYRYALADAYLRRLHPRAAHWYLFVLGVDPELQGRGLGGCLLRTLSDQANRDGVPCYLETDKASSVRLYERHGFEVERDQTEPRLGVRFWTMTRPITAAPF
jgi:ribosomal protein S18 acetylase RimI-like enzyme